MRRYVLTVVVVLLLCQGLAHAVSSPVLPPPLAVLSHLAKSLAQGRWTLHWLASLGRALGGLGLALGLALPWGLLAGTRGTGGTIADALLYLGNPLPKIAFLPLVMTLLGIGDLAKLSLVAAVTVIPLGILVRDGTRSLLAEYSGLARSLGLGPREVLGHILLPGLRPTLFSGLRTGLGMALSVLFISENFATRYGLGYAIMNAWIMADYRAMYGGIALLAATGAALLGLLDHLEPLVCPWTGPGGPEIRRGRGRRCRPRP